MTWYEDLGNFIPLNPIRIKVSGASWYWGGSIGPPLSKILSIDAGLAKLSNYVDQLKIYRKS